MSRIFKIFELVIQRQIISCKKTTQLAIVHLGLLWEEVEFFPFPNNWTLMFCAKLEVSNTIHVLETSSQIVRLSRRKNLTRSEADGVHLTRVHRIVPPLFWQKEWNAVLPGSSVIVLPGHSRFKNALGHKKFYPHFFKIENKQKNCQLFV